MAGEQDPFSLNEIPTIVFYGKEKNEVDSTIVQALAAMNDDCSDIEDQMMMKLDTSSLARGELNGIKYSAELTAADCFELGRQSYNNGDYYHTLLWMTEANERLRKEANQTIHQSDILEYLAFSTYKQGNIHLALDLTNKLLEIIPTHPRALGNKVYYEDELQKSISSPKKKGDDESEDIQQQDEVHVPSDPYGREHYERLCRGEIKMPVDLEAKLKCRYVSVILLNYSIIEFSKFVIVNGFEYKNYVYEVGMG
uniref:Prolyl 4-hydroxylase subunit alpha-2-like n=1 Tax=Diabrotica virgifera virgifera TaxID=50390 RepID=A0A6P7GZK3_DIAVI